MELSRASWRKSSRSNPNGANCVEVAIELPGVVGMRDSKDRGGPALTPPCGGWAVFVAGIKGGDFDR